MDEYRQVNRQWWDERVDIHVRSTFYRLDEFRAGQSMLDPIVREEVGEVSGKSLLHLQCHFGLDSLSWARLGAQVTGVDFSPRAISRAQDLATKEEIDARFVESDLYDLPEKLDESFNDSFDVVFTSYGALPWLSNLPEWARIVARYLKPGGVFFIAEGHPLALALDDETDDGLRIRYPCMGDAGDALKFHSPGTYADRDAACESETTYEWCYTLSEVIMALLDARIELQTVREYPFCYWECVPSMEKGDDGWYRLPKDWPAVPLMFTIRGTK